jgi:hypothetical protein
LLQWVSITRRWWRWKRAGYAIASLRSFQGRHTHQHDTDRLFLLLRWSSLQARTLEEKFVMPVSITLTNETKQTLVPQARHTFARHLAQPSARLDHLASKSGQSHSFPFFFVFFVVAHRPRKTM